MNRRALVVETGAANTASVFASLRRLNLEPHSTQSASEIAAASHVVLPGVGAFASAMNRLSAEGVIDALRKRIEDQKPTLAICLGLQLLCETSEESDGARGLGVLPVKIRRFTHDLPVPQLGWNQVEPSVDCSLLSPGWAVFANSFYLDSVPQGWNGAFTEYGERFVSAVERGPVLACQFHPELSGQWGQDLLGRWAQQAKSA
ncbi:MAG: imidazole glycerol phosphate synthase glutamine amidotransferase subunit [Planctomycetota bacterium]